MPGLFDSIVIFAEVYLTLLVTTTAEVPLVAAPVAKGEPATAVNDPSELILKAATPDAVVPLPVTAAYRYVPLASMETRPVPVALTVVALPVVVMTPVDSLKAKAVTVPLVASETKTKRPSGSKVTEEGAVTAVASGPPGTAVKSPSVSVGSDEL